jgi:mannose-6-phosphate isomerase-like protein (cupin superfamily)
MLFVKSEEECPEFLAGDATLLKELIHPNNDPIEINYSLAKGRLAPGESSLPHKLGSSEVFYVTAGTGKAMIDRNAIEIAQGSIIFIPPNTDQYLINEGKEFLEFICIVEPFWKLSDEKVTKI